MRPRCAPAAIPTNRMGRPRAWPRIRCPGRRATRLEQPSRGDWRSMRRENLASATPVLMIRHRSAASRCGANWVPRPAFPSPPPRRGLAHSGTISRPRRIGAAGSGRGDIGGGVHEASRDRRTGDSLPRSSSQPPARRDRERRQGRSSSASRSRSRAARRADGQPTLKGAQLPSTRSTRPAARRLQGRDSFPLDHAVNGKYNEQQGAQDMQTFVNDPAVIGVVGPYNSAVAKVQIPISNDAGLLQCSPANTNQGLTKPRVRRARPAQEQPREDQLHPRRDHGRHPGPGHGGVRRSTPWASRTSLIIDDVTTFGKGVADTFQAKFEELGGTVVDRVGAGADTTDFNAIITAAKEKNPEGVYYGGVVTSGGGLAAQADAPAGPRHPVPRP